MVADRPFKVVSPQRTNAELRALARIAIDRDARTQFVTALKTIREKLATEPLTWGDIYYRLPKMNLIFCRGALSPLQVFYGVNEERRLVFIRDVYPLTGSVLAD